MPVTITQDAEARAVQASLTWTAGPTLFAPAWSGLVTGVKAAPGSLVQSGTAIASIDGITRIALASTLPFYRMIAPGTIGPDVTALRGALARLGISPVGSGTSYDPALEGAIKTLEARLIGEALGLAKGVFDPSWVIYLPVANLKVAAVNLQVGLPAPGEGQPIATSPQSLNPFTLAPAASNGLIPLPLPSNPTDFVFSPAPGVDVPVGESYTISSPTDLASVAAIVSQGSSTASGQINLSHAATLSTVPATAVVSDSAGRTCVFVTSGRLLVPLLVTTASGLPGATEVVGLPASVERVIANPGEVAAGRGCT
jgi:hypothetical protein